MVEQIEVPDGVRAVHLIGQDAAGDPQVVLVDTAGRLMAVIYGSISGITDPVTVDQSAKDREIQGADGATLRTVAVDASGQIVMVPRGQGGNYLDVDASGYLTSVMKGLEGVNLRTLAVDASGNLIAVIKGDYEGALKTLATDADGRLLAVPYDPEDVWGNAVGMGISGLAAVLTPVGRFDKRGEAVFWDSFDHGFCQWIASAVGTGADILTSCATARTGTYSAKMVTGTTGSFTTAVSKYQPRPSLARIGLEASFAPASDHPFVDLQIYHYTGAGYYLFWVRYDHPGQRLRYYNSAGAWADLATSLAFFPSQTSYNTLKLVVDLSTNKFERILYVDTEHDVSAQGGFWVGGASAPYLALAVQVIGDAGDNRTVYVDDIILTQNEPAN